MELVDFSPSSESGNCLSLDSVTIGASASGINGTVNLSVGNDSVNSIDNQSDPDVTVETVYEYGNWWGGDNCGGENVISAGNAGVFLWDGKKDHGYNIMSNNIIGTFEARDSKGGVVVTDDIGYAFSTINTEL